MENFRKYSNNSKNNSIQILQIDFIYYEKSGIHSFSNCIKTKSLFKMHIVKSTFILYTVLNITITNKRTLSDQHLTSFAAEGITLLDYRHADQSDRNLETDATLCINSLFKFMNSLEFDSEIPYVIYIDEIVSFLSLTHNETLNHNLI